MGWDETPDTAESGAVDTAAAPAGDGAAGDDEGSGAAGPFGTAEERPRLTALQRDDADGGRLAERLLRLAVTGLPRTFDEEAGEFAYTRIADVRDREAPDGWRTRLRGTSNRYAAISMLGTALLPENEQKEALAGRSLTDVGDRLLHRINALTDLGEVALICWAVAETGHPRLERALDRLRVLMARPGPRYVVDTAWVLSALVAADRRGALGAAADRELQTTRASLLGARIGDRRMFPHATDGGLVPWYRAHVGCFADQVYPIQALARLHAHRGDPDALAAADACAERICALQGSGGQWWWHYDARHGRVVEGFPVYSVHQHAMAPMALFDLAEAGGADHAAEVRRGLRWMTAAPEATERLVYDDLAMTWRKTARADRWKLVRGARGASTRLLPGLRLGVLDRVYPPVTVDRECRPYELGWMLYAWLGRPNLLVTAPDDGADVQAPATTD